MPGHRQARGLGNLRCVTRRFRCHVPEDDAWYWFETGDDGWVLRQAVFEGALAVPPLPEGLRDEHEGVAGGASVAASQAQLTLVREEFGLLGVQFYEAVYGVLAEGPVEVPPGAKDVTKDEFDRAWRTAVRHRHFTRYDSGPLPEGTRVPGMVSALPWGAGRTGLAVDIGMPGRGFVDMLLLPRAAEDWPPVGTVTEFEVVTVRFDLDPERERRDLEIRLRPTATPSPGEPWPRPGPR